MRHHKQQRHEHECENCGESYVCKHPDCGGQYWLCSEDCEDNYEPENEIEEVIE